MKSAICVWLLFACVIAPPLRSQQDQKLDSLLAAYKNHQEDTLKVITLAHLYNTVLYTNPDAAISYAKEELLLSEKLHFTKGIGWSTYHLGAYYQNAGKLDSATYYYSKSLQIYKDQKNKPRYANVLSALANIEYSKGNYDAALEKYEETLNVYRETSIYNYAITKGDRANVYIDKGFYKIALQETLDALRILDTIYEKPWRKADAQRQVGHIESLRGNFGNALVYFKSALEIYKEQNDNIYQAVISNDIGQTFFNLKEYDSSIYYLDKGLKLARELEISENEGNLLTNLGKVYTKKKEPLKALELLHTALKIHSENGYMANILETQNEIANAHLEMGNAREALPYLDQTIAKASGTGPINALKDAYNLRFKTLRQLGKSDDAIEDQATFQRLTDSIFNTTKSRQIEELRTIYETEKKEQQIALQENEIELLEEKQRAATLQNTLLIGGILALISLFGLLYYGIRQKMKRNKLEKQKVETELEFKKKELTTHALNLARKNEVLETVKQKASALKSEQNHSGYQDLVRTINFDQQDDRNWENFIQYFEQVHKDFSANIKRKYPEITSNELRLLALLKMNLSSKEIANILNISPEGIKKARYRLRKKLNITTEESLQDLVLSL